MTKKTQRPPRRPCPRPNFYGVLRDDIPIGPTEKIFDYIEAKSQGTPAHDPYRARIEALMARERAYHDHDDREDAEHLRETRGGLVLEETARFAGFVLGFEFAQWMRIQFSGGGQSLEQWMQNGGGRTKGGAR